ncbi:hypothetical protein PN499_11080 [Kamptonema animale CS-326]|uniref:hypothetical protein n=1 Tax=Kamptonema animale TaxID=92934 RepID=UPI00232E4C30|nr:hypothetical protein [Kamptonema animale]MDB9511728.1 hypothetical protein [Kamptonema animale CS-326]
MARHINRYLSSQNANESISLGSRGSLLSYMLQKNPDSVKGVLSLIMSTYTYLQGTGDRYVMVS